MKPTKFYEIADCNTVFGVITVAGARCANLHIPLLRCIQSQKRNTSQFPHTSVSDPHPFIMLAKPHVGEAMR